MDLLTVSALVLIICNLIALFLVYLNHMNLQLTKRLRENSAVDFAMSEVFLQLRHFSNRTNDCILQEALVTLQGSTRRLLSNAYRESTRNPQLERRMLSAAAEIIAGYIEVAYSLGQESSKHIAEAIQEEDNEDETQLHPVRSF